MNRGRQVFVGAAVFGAAACASLGMNSVERVNRLSVGMDSAQVIQILGAPKSSEVKDNQLVLRYRLHQNWKGWVPYYFVFDRDTGRLVSWHEDDAEYQREQQQLAQALAPVLERPQQQNAAAPAGPNDPELQRWLTGNYYHFSSSAVVSASSERSLVLCGDGRFRMTGEFGAGQAGEWGAASRSGSGGRWSISGTREAGTITLSFAGGGSRNVAYRVASREEQTIYFDEVLFAFAGAANCD